MKAWSEEQVQLDGLPPWRILPLDMKASLMGLFEGLPAVEVVSVFAERTPSPASTALSDEDDKEPAFVSQPTAAAAQRVTIPGFDGLPKAVPVSPPVKEEKPEVHPPDWHQFLLYKSTEWEWQLYKDWSAGSLRLKGFPQFEDLPEPVRLQLQPLLNLSHYTSVQKQQLEQEQLAPPAPPPMMAAPMPPPMPPHAFSTHEARPFFNEMPAHFQPPQIGMPFQRVPFVPPQNIPPQQPRPGRWYASRYHSCSICFVNRC